MKLSHRVFTSPSVKMPLMILAILFTLFVGPAQAASEPGTITIVLGTEPRSLDPSDSTSMFPGQVMIKNILEGLTERHLADSSITPGLAISWKQIDATTWHFFLRKGVKFHDGTDFNAETVVFNFKRIYDKKINGLTKTKFFSAGSQMEVQALDKYAVEIKTGKPEPLMLTLIGMLGICSPSTPMEMTRNPIGTGPYKCVKWDAGTQIVLERFDGYWGKQPQVKKAVYVWRNESSVRAAMIEIGEADFAPDIARQNANRPDMDQSYLNSETTVLRFGGVWEPPLNDRRVRMALNYAINREAIRGSILSKDVVPATQLMGPSILGYNPDLKVWPYDPQKAKQLLTEARKDGVPVDKEILLLGKIGHFAGAAELIEAVMTMYKAIGLNVKLKMIESGAFRPYDNKPFPPGLYIAQRSHDNNYGDAAFTAFFNYHCKSSISSMCDKTMDDLIEKAQVATGEERNNLWHAVFRRAHDEIIPDVVLFHMVGYARVGKRINIKSSATIGEIEIAQMTFKQ